MKCEDELSTNRMLVILVMPVNVANDLRLSRGTKSSVDVMMDDVVNQVIKKRKIIDRVIKIITHKRRDNHCRDKMAKINGEKWFTFDATFAFQTRMSPGASAFVIFNVIFIIINSAINVPWSCSRIFDRQENVKWSSSYVSRGL